MVGGFEISGAWYKPRLQKQELASLHSYLYLKSMFNWGMHA